VPQQQTARLLRLLSLLQSRREWPGAELAGRLEVTGRTIRRDIDQLRELGYPIEGTTGAAGGYRLHSGKDLPPLLLDDEEAIAIAAGLRTAAEAGIAGVDEASVRALAKLEQLLPARLRRRIDAAAAATTAVAIPRGATLDPATLGSVAAACRDHEVLAFQYRTREGSGGRRRVEPHSLVAVTGLWYLVAYDLARDGWRVYRLDRVADPVATRNHFAPRPLPARGPADLLRERLREAPYRYRVKATVGLPAGQVRALLPRLLPTRLREVDAGTCEVELGDDALGALVADLTRLDADLRLEGPPETLDAIARSARRVEFAADPGSCAR
jgi:predicted DNA-binding transcriptional regulator YafY